MKACIDECQPNTSQANYSEGFWRITSKINAKIEVRKHLESVHANRRSPKSVPHVLETATISFSFCVRFAFRRQILAYFDEFKQQISLLLVSNSIFFWESSKQSVLVNFHPSISIKANGITSHYSGEPRTVTSSYKYAAPKKDEKANPF